LSTIHERDRQIERQNTVTSIAIAEIVYQRSRLKSKNKSTMSHDNDSEKYDLPFAQRAQTEIFIPWSN